MVRKNIALVLGGGGAAGNAWLIGLVAGLAEAGLDMSEVADLVIGTSAGATAAALVRSGISPADLLISAMSEPPRALEQKRGPQSVPMERVFERMRAIGAAATSTADLQRAMGLFGLECDLILGPVAAEERRAVVAARLPFSKWPDRPMLITAVDANSGELVAFSSMSGVDLVDAVTASTALPGMAPTHGINGARYISGGVRSAENADLASGYANVMVLSPLGGRSGARPAGQFEGLRRFPGSDLGGQLEALRDAGSRVALITPDIDSRAAMGTNQMDLAARVPAARAGFAQGKREGARINLVDWIGTA